MKIGEAKWYELNLRPLQGQFNLEEIEAYVLNIPFTVVDPVPPPPPLHKTYLICLDQAGLDHVLDARYNDPERGIPRVCTVVDMKPDFIGIGICYDDENATVVKIFVDWLLAKYQCRITDDYAHDWTQEVATGGTAVLFNLLPETPETATP